MKRSGVAWVVMAVAISLLSPAFSATPPKAGQKCTSLNKKQAYKNYQYTCVKKSGKLVWSKGVLVKKETPSAAAPTSSSSPATIPSIDPMPSPSPTPSALPSQKPTASPSPTPVLDESSFVFSDICQKDPFIPEQWIELEKLVNPLGYECSWPYRIVRKAMPLIKPLLETQENVSNIELCKLKQNPKKLNILAWPVEHVDFWFKYQRHLSINTTIQLIPIYSPDAPDNGKNPIDDYKPYLDYLSEWVSHASDGTGKLTIRSPERYLEFPNRLSDYVLIHERPQSEADRFRKAIENFVVPKINFSGSNLGIIVMPPGTKASLSQQVGLNQIDANGTFVMLTIMPPKTWNQQNVSGGNFFHPAWWLHEIHHVTAGFDDNDHTSPNGLHWWGLISYGSNEMLGWHKWLIGFWGDSKITCVDSSRGGTYWIAPSTYQTDKKKLLVLPISSSKALVVESMRAGGLNYKMPPSMEGALVYVVDTSLTSSHSGMYVVPTTNRKLLNPTLKTISRTFFNSDAALRNGESAIFEGFKISIIESGTFGDVIKVERA